MPKQDNWVIVAHFDNLGQDGRIELYGIYYTEAQAANRVPDFLKRFTVEDDPPTITILPITHLQH